MTKILFQALTHHLTGPSVSVHDYDPRFRSFHSDDRLISAQEIAPALLGQLGPGNFKVACWRWK